MKEFLSSSHKDTPSTGEGETAEGFVDQEATIYPAIAGTNSISVLRAPPELIIRQHGSP
jgi:hypothetical protein